MHRVLQPEFIEGSTGRLLITCFVPPGGTHRWLLFVPPFAEEMNKSRRMLSKLGRALAAEGVGFCLPDQFGSGDSAGDFSEATLSIWQQDLQIISRWLSERHGCRQLSIGGLRLGALQALTLSGALPHATDLILWQPVQKGQQQLTQFLRLRQAAAMMRSGPGEGIKDLRQRLTSGETLEIAGYRLSSQMADELDAANMSPEALTAKYRIIWLEVSSREQPQLAPVSATTIESWREQGLAIEAEAVSGDGFWQTQEICEAPALIDATLRLVTETTQS